MKEKEILTVYRKIKNKNLQLFLRPSLSLTSFPFLGLEFGVWSKKDLKLRCDRSGINIENPGIRSKIKIIFSGAVSLFILFCFSIKVEVALHVRACKYIRTQRDGWTEGISSGVKHRLQFSHIRLFPEYCRIQKRYHS